MDYSPPRSSVHGILQARILEWAPFLSPGDLRDPGIEPGFPALWGDSLPSETSGKPGFMHFLSMSVSRQICLPILGLSLMSM